MTDTHTNWAGNYVYSAARWHRPETVEQVQALVTRCRKLRVVGTRHSFNAIADTPEDMLSMERFDASFSLDRQRRTVTVGAGMRYGELARALHAEGFALHNLASLPHISVAGACATATHGSGDGHGSLATAVRALTLVTANGEVVTLTREHDGETFLGAVVGLGGLGVVTHITLEVVRAFAVRQDVYENLALAQLEAHFDAVTSLAYSVSVFTDWRGPRFNQLWVKRRVTAGEAFEPPREVLGATLAPGPLHPIPGFSPVNCTEQMGVSGPWHERLPHFRLAFTPSSGEELQAEYIVPRRHAFAALSTLHGLRGQIAPLLQISEVRTVAADSLWMSPFYRQDSVCLHFTWIKDWPRVSALLPLIEDALAPFEARPHWGKLFTLPPGRVQSLYPKLPDFRRLLERYDPEGKFRNAFMDAYIFGEP